MVKAMNGIMFVENSKRARRNDYETDDFSTIIEEIRLKKQSLLPCHFAGCDDTLFYCFKRGSDAVYRYSCQEHLPSNSNDIFNFGKLEDLAEDVHVKCMLRDIKGNLCESDAVYYISDTKYQTRGKIQKSNQENENLTAFCKEHESVIRTNPYLIRQRKTKSQLNTLLKEAIPNKHNARIQYTILTTSGLKHVVYMWLTLYTNDVGKKIYVSEGRLGPKAICESRLTSDCNSTRGINGGNECVGCDEAWRLFRRQAPKGEYTTKD